MAYKPKVGDRVFDMMATATDKTDVALEKGVELDKSTESIHTALMAAGFAPGIGNIADITDATLYALEGELGNAAWSAVAAIPIIGQMVSAKRALKVAKESGEEMVTLYRGVEKWSRKQMVKKGKFVGPESPISLPPITLGPTNFLFLTIFFGAHSLTPLYKVTISSPDSFATFKALFALTIWPIKGIAAAADQAASPNSPSKAYNVASVISAILP